MLKHCWETYTATVSPKGRAYWLTRYGLSAQPFYIMWNGWDFARKLHHELSLIGNTRRTGIGLPVYTLHTEPLAVWPLGGTSTGLAQWDPVPGDICSGSIGSLPPSSFLSLRTPKSTSGLMAATWCHQFCIIQCSHFAFSSFNADNQLYINIAGIA